MNPNENEPSDLFFIPPVCGYAGRKRMLFHIDGAIQFSKLNKRNLLGPHYLSSLSSVDPNNIWYERLTVQTNIPTWLRREKYELPYRKTYLKTF